MSVWLTIPSARQRAEAQACIDRWRSMGYLVAIHRDTGDEIVDCDYLSYGDYQGYAKTVNALIREVMKHDTAAEWFVLGGDDTDPDQNKRAAEIAEECEAHFEVIDLDADTVSVTFGVMQPTGDRFAGGSIDRIAGSPWIGRQFVELAYGGDGPLWHEYAHMFEDEELMAVAEKLGVYWRRPDLTHFHRHFMRASDAIDAPAVQRPVPPHLREANSPEHWHRSKAIFESRKAAWFPGHEVRVAVAA